MGFLYFSFDYWYFGISCVLYDASKYRLQTGKKSHKVWMMMVAAGLMWVGAAESLSSSKQGKALKSEHKDSKQLNWLRMTKNPQHYDHVSG